MRKATVTAEFNGTRTFTVEIVDDRYTMEQVLDIVNDPTMSLGLVKMDPNADTGKITNSEDEVVATISNYYQDIEDPGWFTIDNVPETNTKNPTWMSVAMEMQGTELVVDPVVAEELIRINDQI